MRFYCDLNESLEHHISPAASVPAGETKAVIAFASAKGGVGKSSLLANVAATLALKGRKVGIVDGDLNAPVIGNILGIKRLRAFSMMGQQIDPVNGPLGLRVIGTNLLDDREPVALRFGDEESLNGSVQEPERHEI